MTITPSQASLADGAPAFLAGGGETGRLIAGRDWSATPLGPLADWPQSLKTAVGLLLRSPVPIVLLWGGEGVMLYNDAYSVFAGGRHPELLGSNVREGWPEVADFNDHVMRVGLSGGTLSYKDQELTLFRHGRPEQVFMNLDYSPVLDETGRPGGVIAVVVETTERVLAERRVAFRLTLEERLRDLADPVGIMAAAAETLGRALGIARVGYGDIDAAGEHVAVERDWTDGRVASLAGRYRMDDFGPEIIAELRAGRTMWVDDANADPRVGPSAAAFAAIETRAVLAVPLFKEGRFAAMLYLHHPMPHRWEASEVALAQEVVERTWAAVEQARAEMRLRASEEELRFMSGLDEALRQAHDAPAAMGAAAEHLARRLDASRTAYADVDADNDRFVIRSDYTAPGIASSAGTYSLDLFGPRAAADMRAGRTLVVRDVAGELAPGEGRDMFQSIGIDAIVCCPLVKDGRLVAMMAVHQDRPRDWGNDEIALVEAVVERCWAHVERVGAEARLRDSEEFNRRVLASSADCIKVLSLDGRLEFMSEGGMCVMEVDDFGAIRGACWPEFWKGEEHAKALAAVAEARDGGTGRFQGFATTLKGTPRWWDVIVTPINGPDGRPERLLSVSRDITEQKRAHERLRENEERLRLAQEAGRVGLFEWRIPEGRIVWSAALEALYGVPEGTFEGGFEDWRKRVVKEDADWVAAEIEACLRERRTDYAYEFRIVLPDGSLRWAAGQARFTYDGEGKPLRMTGVNVDIHDRKQAEEQLRESEARFRNMADHAPVMMWVTDPSGSCTYLNRSWYEFTGQTHEEAAGLGWLEATHPDDKAEAERIFLEANARREPFRLEYRLRRHDGAYRWAIDAASPRFGPGGEFLGYIGSVIDIDDRREVEDRLRESEARLKAVFDAAPVGIVLAEAPSGRIVGGNAQAERIFGHPILPSDGVDGYRDWVSRHADGRRVEPEEYPLAAVIREGVERAELEVLYHRGDGRDAWVRLIAAPIRDEKGGVAGGVVAALDIDRKRRVEAELRRLNETLEAEVAARTAERNRIWQMSRDLFAIMGFDGHLKAVNPAWQQTLGFDEATLLARDFSQQVHPDDHASILALMERLRAGETVVGFEDRLRHADGSWRWISWTLVPSGEVFYAVGRDVTAEKARQAELEAAQDALRQAQKMEAVGQLTGGIAHDFNNLLTGIIGSLDMLQRRVAQGRTGEIERFVSTATASANRAAALTHRLLAFSRRQPLDPKPVDANRLVTSMEELLRRTLGEAYEIEIVTAGGLWQTLCDPHQLESALLNLAINARDAMPDGGKLTVETCNAHLDNAYVAKAREVRPGQYVCICVSDTGTGMSKETIEKAFEPFFTTKPIGQGTGLGLSMVYGFARQSDGYARIYSELGQGTTVKLYLPRFYGEGENSEEAARSAELPAPRAEHGEVVLVVEDEPAVRALVTEVLADLGYHALEATDGPSGLKILESRRRVDLLVTDVGLPGLNGRQLADAARAKRPGLKVLFMTGYAENAAIANGFLEPGMELITKPFAVDALASRIRGIIEKD